MLRTATVIEHVRVVRVLIGGEPLLEQLREFEEELKDMEGDDEPAGSRSVADEADYIEGCVGQSAVIGSISRTVSVISAKPTKRQPTRYPSRSRQPPRRPTCALRPAQGE